VNRTRLAALGLGAILAAGSLAAPLVTMAAGNTIKVTPATTTFAGTTGNTFTVSVVANTSVAISGAGATLSFDKSRLQLTSVAKDTAVTTDGAGYAGFPSASNMASFVAAANAAGSITGISWYFSDGSSFEAAGVDHVIYTATFQVIAAGDSSLVPSDASGGSLISGDSSNYGDTVSVDSFVSAQVLNTVPATPSPTITPVPTPTNPPASAPPGSGTTNVNGSVDSGFLGLSVPSSVTIPLVRNATNRVDVPVTIYSNIIWNLQVSDQKTSNTGFMTDGTKVLANPMHVQQGLQTDPAGDQIPVYDANLSYGLSGQSGIPQTIATGNNSTNVTTTLAQFVAPQDQPGSYGMQILYSAISGF